VTTISSKGLLKINLNLVFLLLSLLVLASQPANAATATSNSGGVTWQNLGLTLPASKYSFCYDAGLPDNLLVSKLTDAGAGTFNYNLPNGQTTQLNTALFTTCADNGLWYWDDTQHGHVYRYSHTDPNGKIIERLPQFMAKDGSLVAYSLDTSDWRNTKATKAQNHLWITPDGGLTWQERGQNLPGAFVSLVVAPADANALYLMTRTLQTNNDQYICTLYFSNDAGQTWDKRGEFNSSPYSLSPDIFSLQTKTASEDTLLKITRYSSMHEGPAYELSLDGGRTFQERFYYCVYDCAPTYYDKAFYPDFWYGTDGVYQFSLENDGDSANGIYKFDYQLQTFQDLNHPQKLALPDEVQNLFNPQIEPFANNPNNLLLTASTDRNNTASVAWYSSDQGRSWQKLSEGMDQYLISPYAPFTLVGLKKNQLYRIDLPNATKSLTKGVLPSESGTYYKATNHNLTGIFKTYWEQHGGLSQCGYPWTETFREVNPSDGKVYLVQYFERNRFEYHPENAGTPYEVLLGLLGNQLTAQRQAAGEGTFKHFADAHYPAGIYFPETGHNLRNSFKAYWEAHGGLSLYGYPISEEFEEINPDNGQTYIVQYFERNRFEYHPENVGTAYEVELGLLGNNLLRQKGWF
jgi:hypothetical protein